jgi:uncharacterized protein YigE (DUF2233 family)
MDRGKRRAVILVVAHLAIPALILLVIVAAGASASRAAVWTLRKDSGWQRLEEGLDLREWTMAYSRRHDDGNVTLELPLTAVRVETRRFRLRSVANPARQARTLAELAAGEKLPAVTNGGYFDGKGQPDTLLISGGEKLAPASEKLPWCGVLAVDQKGRARIGTLEDVAPPYTGIDFAVQNSPLLASGGRSVWPPPKKKPPGADQRRFRRTAAALDAAGRLVLLVCNAPVGLSEFAELLGGPEREAGLEVRFALNLDGGPSSGLAVDHPESGTRRHVASGVNVPYVIAVEKRPEPIADEAPAPEGKPAPEFVTPK